MKKPIKWEIKIPPHRVFQGFTLLMYDSISEEEGPLNVLYSHNPQTQTVKVSTYKCPDLPGNNLNHDFDY